MIDLLSREIDGIDSEIDDDIRGSPIWKVKEDLLASVPGIGKITARTLLAEMPELGQLDRRTVASLSGVAPYTRQSGQWKGKSFTGGGRSPVKRALYMAAVSASRFVSPGRLAPHIVHTSQRHDLRRDQLDPALVIGCREGAPGWFEMNIQTILRHIDSHTYNFSHDPSLLNRGPHA
jgi:transposase